MLEPEKAKGHVVFDCDGTLISSYEGVIQSLRQFWGEVLGREISEKEMKEKYYPQIDVMAREFSVDTEDQARKKELLDHWGQVCARQNHQYALFNDIEALLQECKLQQWSLYVWTGRDRQSTLEILQALGIMPFFWDVRTASDGIPKPHPMGMEELVGEFDREKIVLIGDSRADLDGAKNFGCHFIGATWCDHADKKGLENSMAADSPLECLVKIKKLLK